MASKTLERVAELVEFYLDARERRHDFVSIQTAHKALAQVLPRHAIPERALDDMIAGRAIARGLCVDFDREPDDHRRSGTAERPVFADMRQE